MDVFDLSSESVLFSLTGVHDLTKRGQRTIPVEHMRSFALLTIEDLRKRAYVVCVERPRMLV